MSFDVNEVKAGSILFFWYPVLTLTTATRKEEERARREEKRDLGRFFEYDRYGVLLKVLSKASAPTIGFVIWCEDRWGRPYEIRERVLVERKAMSRLELTNHLDFPRFIPRCPMCEHIIRSDADGCSCGFMQRSKNDGS